VPAATCAAGTVAPTAGARASAVTRRARRRAAAGRRRRSPRCSSRPDLRAEPVVDGVERVRVLGGGGRDELAAAVDWLPEAVLEARELGRATVSLHAPIGDGARELGDLLPAPTTTRLRRSPSAPRRARWSARRCASWRTASARSSRRGSGSTPTPGRSPRPRQLGLRPGEVRRLEAPALRKLRAAPGADAPAA